MAQSFECLVINILLPPLPLLLVDNGRNDCVDSMVNDAGLESQTQKEGRSRAGRKNIKFSCCSLLLGTEDVVIDMCAGPAHEINNDSHMMMRLGVISAGARL
jgi:hypothetical protein